MAGPVKSAHEIRSTGTSNPKLAAALAAVGVPLDKKPLTKMSTTGDTPNKYSWSFGPVSDNGLFRTRDLIQAWEDPTWVDANPDHPFAYIKVAFQNHRFLLDLVKQGRTLGVVQFRDKYGMIPLDWSQKEADVVLARLEGKRA